VGPIGPFRFRGGPGKKNDSAGAVVTGKKPLVKQEFLFSHISVCPQHEAIGFFHGSRRLGKDPEAGKCEAGGQSGRISDIQRGLPSVEVIFNRLRRAP